MKTTPLGRTFKKEDLINFIKSQPDDREVDMETNWADKDRCGCLLVHFYRHVTGRNEMVSCGWCEVFETGVSAIVEIPGVSSLIQRLVEENCETYGEVKDLL
jgi:hypothetical protein